MTELKIKIDENKIVEAVEKEVAKSLAHEYCAEARDAKYGIRKGVEKAVRDYVYSTRDEIVERAVTRAAESIVRKGLPKIIESFAKDGKYE